MEVCSGVCDFLESINRYLQDTKNMIFGVILTFAVSMSSSCVWHYVYRFKVPYSIGHILACAFWLACSVLGGYIDDEITLKSMADSLVYGFIMHRTYHYYQGQSDFSPFFFLHLSTLISPPVNQYHEISLVCTECSCPLISNMW